MGVLSTIALTLLLVFGQAELNPLIGKARDQIDQAEFSKARATLTQALRDPDNTDSALIEIYRLLGIVNAYVNDRAGAEAAFTELLRLAPEYALPKSAPPKVREIFDKVKTRAKATQRVTLQVQLPDRLQGGKATRAEVQIAGMQPGFRAFFYFRRAGDSEWRYDELEPLGGGRFAVTLPASSLAADRHDYALEYYAEVQNSARLRVASVGDALNPRRALVEKVDESATVEPSKPWYKRWWVWLIIGGAAAGAAGTAYVIATRDGSDGTVPVRVRVE